MGWDRSSQSTARHWASVRVGVPYCIATFISKSSFLHRATESFWSCLLLLLFNPTRLQPRIVCSYARIGWHGRQSTRRSYSVPRRPTSLLQSGAICPQRPAVFPLAAIKTCSVARQESRHYLNSVMLGSYRRSASCFASNVPTVSPQCLASSTRL